MKYLEDYLHFLRSEKKYSEDTINSYELDILEYINYAENNNISIEKAKYNDISKFLMDLSNRKEKATTLFSEATKKIDQACTKGVIVKNTAARKKSNMAKKLNAMK